MNPGCEERKLALRLSALSASDRQWVLSQIEDAPRARMTALLDELEALGFRVDESMLEDVAARVESMMPASRQGQDPILQLVATIDRADVQHVIAVLSKEPPEVRGEILRMHPWQWRRSVLAQFGLVEAGGNMSVQAERTQQAMLKAFSCLLAARQERASEERHDSAGDAPARRRRWFKWLG